MSSETPASLPQADPAPPSDCAMACPRCQEPLIDPAGLGWCKACGYCRTLETEKNNALLNRPAGPTPGALLKGAARGIPNWFWLLIGGISLLAALSLLTDYLLPPGKCLPRALWTSIQIPIGLLIVFLAQMYAVLQVAPDDERLSFKDALVPMRLWYLVGKRLPAMWGCLCSAVWGASLALFAVLFIGGLGHWFTYLPGTNKGVNKAAQKDANVRR